jgi:hypothetical protein
VGSPAGLERDRPSLAMCPFLSLRAFKRTCQGCPLTVTSLFTRLTTYFPHPGRPQTTQPPPTNHPRVHPGWRPRQRRRLSFHCSFLPATKGARAAASACRECGGIADAFPHCQWECLAAAPSALRACAACVFTHCSHPAHCRHPTTLPLPHPPARSAMDGGTRVARRPACRPARQFFASPHALVGPKLLAARRADARACLKIAHLQRGCQLARLATLRLPPCTAQCAVRSAGQAHALA